MSISQQNEAWSRDYALLLSNDLKGFLNYIVSEAAMHSPYIWTVWNTIYAQPRWQTFSPAGIGTQYLCVSSHNQTESGPVTSVCVIYTILY